MLRIEILHFEKFNPRKDLKTMPWFRVESNIAHDPKLYKLDAEQKWFWIYLLSLAAFDNKSIIEADLEYLEKYSCVSGKKIKTALEILNKNNMVTSTRTDLYGIRTDPIGSATLRTNERNERTDERTKAIDNNDQYNNYINKWNLFTEQLLANNNIKKPKISSLTKERTNRIKYHEKDNELTLDKFTESLKKSANSQMLMDAKWFNFDWLFRKQNSKKEITCNWLDILEGGKYENN